MWEYKTVTVENMFTAEQMDGYAQEEWELVSVSILEWTSVAYFKRPYNKYRAALQEIAGNEFLDTAFTTIEDARAFAYSVLEGE